MEKWRAREAEFGAAARRLDRLISALAFILETVKSAGEPLVSLTTEAMRAASNATKVAVAASKSSENVFRQERAVVNDADENLYRQLSTGSPKEAVFVDVVRLATMAMAQAELTLTRAREQVSNISVEKVRALETLAVLAETPSKVVECLASFPASRSLSSSREAAAAISEAQTSLVKPRGAAQADGVA